ncbi:hypothetical protein TNCV_2068391 [Trichonephila clavipes]|uniref:Uncharacterized protein n=1 Tax=Trichonephila clavipes TaxID=2585209 RepID=A0A8X6W2R0_TRICX|nr:hypothetical protein TNCV_2068301 [Trichonephila clavipes]GFY27215.1 hypothetical protein TNCV_2068361 [Trichonephila clavipes]GFY27218.1 hypothetical protein TNCV_2068391 [Trichonephila clavipes]
MEVTRVEQPAYIKITVLQWRNSLFGFDLIPKIKEPIRGRRFATREDMLMLCANGRPDSHMVWQMLRLMVFSASLIVGCVW